MAQIDNILEQVQLAQEPILLTKRELEVARLVARGQSNQEIAKTLGISLQTVKGYVRHCLKKANASGRSQLAILFEAGLLCGGDMSFTRAEREVVSFLARGVSYKEIGKALEISAATVGGRVKSIRHKLGVHNRTAAAMLLRGMGY
ncbi:MAG: response regulator transcription factor [Candidatus Wildermuthbacteria bacterium]|nr:response regulator transcription factor [Candidatus Wildermuthbacteria bacterium]